ncbi:hypothetical protein [Hymenobacter nivis]|uniref:hypothetical protein n=1 Tax=Hymenobacter nivis TaxID=1850093 RepID=UPI001375904C|nr:hypothetical protein [Hymenobacter nivis]
MRRRQAGSPGRWGPQHRAIIAGKFRAEQEFEALLFAKVVAMYLGVEGFVFR